MSEWDDYAEGWDDDAAARAYAAAAYASLVGALETRGVDLDGATVIDFGCGTGLLTEKLVADGASVIAIDSSPAMLAVLDAKSKMNGWTTVSTHESLRAAAASSSRQPVDLVVASSVCSFLDDYPATVTELVSMIRPAGGFFQWDWEKTEGDDHGLSRSEITNALDLAGLTDTSVDVAFAVEIEGQTMSPLLGCGWSPPRG